MTNSKSVNRLLSKAKKIAIFGDVHIGCHDAPAMRTLIECFEREGVDLTFANGDIHDCAAVSPHKGKSKKAALETGQLAEEAASGRWITEWLTTRPCLYGEGNHEDWINDLALDTNTVGTVTVASALGLPESEDFIVLPQGYQVRIGSLAIEHGDEILGRSLGGANLAATVLRRYPAQSTIVNHFHRMDYAVHTTADHSGAARSFSVHSLGHVSDPNAHRDYAGRLPNWQQGGAIVDLWEADGKQRYTIHHIEIHRDRRNRPIFEFNNHIYR